MTFSALFIAIELAQHYFDNAITQQAIPIQINIDQSLQYQLQTSVPSTPLNNIKLSYNAEQSNLTMYCTR